MFYFTCNHGLKGVADIQYVNVRWRRVTDAEIELGSVSNLVQFLWHFDIRQRMAMFVSAMCWLMRIASTDMNIHPCKQNHVRDYFIEMTATLPAKKNVIFAAKMLSKYVRALIQLLSPHYALNLSFRWYSNMKLRTKTMQLKTNIIALFGVDKPCKISISYSCREIWQISVTSMSHRIWMYDIDPSLVSLLDILAKITHR